MPHELVGIRQRGRPPQEQQQYGSGFALSGVPDHFSISATHACAVVRGGTCYIIDCWGRGESGATGYGFTENVGEFQHPVIYGGLDIESPRQVRVGDDLSCAMTVEDQVYCWGAAAGPSGTDGAHGHPGLGNIGDDETAGSVGPLSVW